MALVINVLIVVTSHYILGNTGRHTGYNLVEVAHAYRVFKNGGYNIDFVSPKGGKVPVDTGSRMACRSDGICQDFLKNKEAMDKISNTKKPGDVDGTAYKVIMYAGGRGAMYDIAQDDDIANVAKTVYQSGGIVSAVGHGPAGLPLIRLENGDNIVNGKNVTSFTKEEEDKSGLSQDLPFILETELRERGGIFKAGHLFEANVQVSGRLVTGQNPASAEPMAYAIRTELQKE